MFRGVTSFKGVTICSKIPCFVISCDEEEMFSIFSVLQNVTVGFFVPQLYLINQFDSVLAFEINSRPPEQSSLINLGYQRELV